MWGWYFLAAHTKIEDQLMASYPEPPTKQLNPRDGITVSQIAGVQWLIVHFICLSDGAKHLGCPLHKSATASGEDTDSCTEGRFP